MMMDQVVEIQALNKRYGGKVPVHVLHDINLTVGPSEMVALVGPSGAGKTTLLNIVSTLDEPTSGKVLITGTDVHTLGQRDLNRFRNRRLGFIFQDDLLLGHLTALENVMLPARIARKRPSVARRRAEELLRHVGLADRMKHLPGELSGGQRQRVGIARALVNGPALLLADEPTARLDQATGQGIVELLAELNEQMGVVILMVTHERSVAERARRTVEFLDGRIIADRGAAPPPSELTCCHSSPVPCVLSASSSARPGRPSTVGGRATGSKAPGSDGFPEICPPRCRAARTPSQRKDPGC